MDRLAVSSAVPVEISERISDVSGLDPEPYLDIAKEEITDKIMSGDFRGHGLVSVLDDYLQVTDPRDFRDRLSIITGFLQRIVLAPEKDRGEHIANAETWLRELVEGYVPAQWIEDKALEMAAFDD